ncbi:MAG TPA: hypothetical protein VIV61_03640 [Candidatus Ozemobacteraceae bacterium]
MKDILVTLLICALIGWGYNHLTTRIRLKQAGVAVAARIIDRETTQKATYVKFTYRAAGRDWTRSMQVPIPDAYAGTDTILLTIDPERPGEAALHFRETDLSRELHYTMLAALVWLFWRGTRLMIASTRPNGD